MLAPALFCSKFEKPFSFFAQAVPGRNQPADAREQKRKSRAKGCPA
jgi:hypothetical protein